MSDGKIVLNVWNQNSPMPPGILRRDWQSLTLGVSASFAVFFMLTLLLLWKLPIGGDLGVSLFSAVKLFVASKINSLIPFALKETAENAAFVKEHWVEHDLLKVVALKTGLAAGLASVVSCLVGMSLWKPREGYIHIDGPRLRKGAEAAALAKRESEIEIERSGRDLRIHPAFEMSADRAAKHIFFIGGTGSGKTTAITPLLRQIFDRDDRCVLFDVKGDFTSMFKKGLLIAPWDKRSKIWDIASDCKTKQDAREIAAGLIEVGKDPMWGNAARQVLVGILVFLQSGDGTADGWWGWRDLAECLAFDGDRLLEVMEQHNPEAITALEQAGATTAGILINLQAFLSIVYDLGDAWGDAKYGDPRLLSFSKWLFNEKTKHRQIILQGNGRFAEMMKGLHKSIIRLMTSRINSPEFYNDPKRRLWFVLDEFPQLGKLDNFAPLLEVGRSKGVRVVLGIQSVNQLRKIYGREDAAAWVEMTGTQIICRLAPGDSAEEFSKHLGQRRVERPNLSTSSNGGKGDGSTSFSYGGETLPIVPATTISGNLGPKKDGVHSLLVGFSDHLELVWPYDKSPVVRKPYIEADWVNGKNDRLEMSPEEAARATAFLESVGKEGEPEWLPDTEEETKAFMSPARAIGTLERHGGYEKEREAEEIAKPQQTPPPPVAPPVVPVESRSVRLGDAIKKYQEKTHLMNSIYKSFPGMRVGDLTPADFVLMYAVASALRSSIRAAFGSSKVNPAPGLVRKIGD
jgi:hypothetical protein